MIWMMLERKQRRMRTERTESMTAVSLHQHQPQLHLTESTKIAQCLEEMPQEQDPEETMSLMVLKLVCSKIQQRHEVLTHDA